MVTMMGAINEFESNNLQERHHDWIEIVKLKLKLKGKYARQKPIPKPKNWFNVYGKYKVR